MSRKVACSQPNFVGPDSDQSICSSSEFTVEAKFELLTSQFIAFGPILDAQKRQLTILILSGPEKKRQAPVFILKSANSADL